MASSPFLYVLTTLYLLVFSLEGPQPIIWRKSCEVDQAQKLGLDLELVGLINLFTVIITLFYCVLASNVKNTHEVKDTW
jgi:hypothetical protein